MLTLRRIDGPDARGVLREAHPDQRLFHTPEWLEFVASAQRAEPVVAAVLADGERVGYFTGAIVRRFGMRILGSPFPGWTTDSMGFVLRGDVDRREAADALLRFAFGPLGCVHVELKDRGIRDAAALDGLGFTSTPTQTYEVDLTADEAELFRRMSSACRRAIRKAEKSGVRVETATGVDFADEYHAQLRQVFAKQGLVPTYSVDRVRALIRCVGSTDRLLLARAVAPDGRSIATAIFPAFNGTGYFWGGASVQADQILRPNEMLFWFAMRYWRERGIGALDLGGAGEYKRKYGGAELWIPWFRRSRYPGLAIMRDLARNAVSLSQRRPGGRLTRSEAR